MRVNSKCAGGPGGSGEARMSGWNTGGLSWTEPRAWLKRGPTPREDQGHSRTWAGVMRAWGPQSDLEPEFNHKASSAAALISHAELSQPQWEWAWLSPGCPGGGMCHSRSWALQGSSEGSRRGSRHATTPPLTPRLPDFAHSILSPPGNSVQTSFENTPQTLDSAGTAGESHYSRAGGLVTPPAGKRSGPAVLGHPDFPRLKGWPRLTATSRDYTRGDGGDWWT